MPRITRRVAALTAGGIALAGASAFGGWAAGRAGRDRIPVLEARVRALESAAAAAGAERDRLEAERDRLEARIAASKETPRACPSETLSTAPAQLLARFAVEYPCGWNVLEQPLQRPEGDPGRAGLVVDHLFFSAIPISLTPREGPPTEITLDVWYDDLDAAGDALPARDAWLGSARSRFSERRETAPTTRSGLPVAKLDGTMVLFDEPRPAVLYVWEFTDADGVRRICEAFGLDPSREVRKTLEDLVRSFRPLGS